MELVLILLKLFALVNSSFAQGYRVSDISCFEERTPNGHQLFTATLRKPEGFRGHPNFADDKEIKPNKNVFCQIRTDDSDSSSLHYILKIKDFNRCPVERLKGYLKVRIRFPKLQGIVMLEDKEVTIRCKLPKNTITEKKAASYSGKDIHISHSFQGMDDISESLDYRVAIYYEAVAQSGVFDSRVNDSVVIGTMVQLRATINPNSSWKYAKLTDLNISDNPHDPYECGHVALVKKGCRVKDFESVMPYQPQQSDDHPGEIYLSFQAFMLEKRDSSNQLWVHAKVQACKSPQDCHPELCNDLFQPSGHGRKRRSSYFNHGTVEKIMIGRVTHQINGQPKFRPESHFSLSHQESGGSTSHAAVIPFRSHGQSLNFPSTTDVPRPQVSFGESIGLVVVNPEDGKSQSQPVRIPNCTPYMAATILVVALLVLTLGAAICFGCRMSRAARDAHHAAVENIFRQSHDQDTYFAKNKTFSPLGARCFTSVSV